MTFKIHIFFGLKYSLYILILKLEIQCNQQDFLNIQQMLMRMFEEITKKKIIFFF